MTPLLYLLGVVLFVLAILASIGLHELGHMIPAKAFGGKVTQYFIGFGPTVWSRKRGETEYGVKAIPLGGYVKIVGMLPPDAEHADQVQYDDEGNRVVSVRKSNTGLFAQLVSDARAAEWETITAADEDRLFYRMAWWKKVVVMAGGPTVNLLIAFFIFAALFATVGNPNDENVHTQVDVVSPCIVPAAEQGRACTAQDPVSPAAQAGLEPGDQFVSFNGTPIHSWEQMQGLIRGNNDGKATIVVDRAGQTLTLHTDTLVEPRPTDPNDPKKLTPVGFLGVGAGRHLCPRWGRSTRWTRWAGSPSSPPSRWPPSRSRSSVSARRSSGSRTARSDSPVSIVGGGRIAGETASANDFPIKDKLASLLFLVAGFNFFIGLFNFIPLLPARRRPHRRCALGGAASRRSPACAAAPTPGTSTSPSSCRSPTSWPASCW